MNPRTREKERGYSRSKTSHHQACSAGICHFHAMFFCWRLALVYVGWHIVPSHCDLRRLLTHLARLIGTVDFLISPSLLSDIHASYMPYSYSHQSMHQRFRLESVPPVSTLAPSSITESLHGSDTATNYTGAHARREGRNHTPGPSGIKHVPHL